MRTVLDDQAIEPQPATLRAALGLVRDRAEEAGRIIIEAHGDGAPLPDEYLAEPPEGDAGFAELRFTSVSRGAFLSETLRDAVHAGRIRHALALTALTRVFDLFPRDVKR